MPDTTTDTTSDDVALLDGPGHRVNPRTYTVHRATCPTQRPDLRPEVLPWPKYADHDDHPCKVCHPHLDPTPLKNPARGAESAGCCPLLPLRDADVPLEGLGDAP